MKSPRSLLLIIGLIPYSVGVDANAQTLRIVAFGDSTTAPRDAVKQVYSERLPSLLAAVGMEARVINSGLGGSHTGRLSDNARHRRQHALDRLDHAVRDQKPDIVVVQFGINDSWVDADEPSGESRIPVDAYRRNLTQIIARLKADGCRIMLMTPNQLGEKVARWRRTRLAQYAEAAREVAVREDVDLVDVWKHYEDYAKQPGRIVDDLLLDGMHPNDMGHQLVAELLAKRIEDRERRAEDTPDDG